MLELVSVSPGLMSNTNVAMLSDGQGLCYTILLLDLEVLSHIPPAPMEEVLQNPSWGVFCLTIADR